MTRIKICGITNLEDARAAVDYGADALGFIFVPESPRYVGAGKETAWLPRELDAPFVSRVYVCRKLSDANLEWAEAFDTVQYYEDDLPRKAVAAGGRRLLQAFRMRDMRTLEEIAASQSRAPAYVLDSYDPDRLGGSGTAFNWMLAAEARARFGKPIVLAGGLDPDNVADAIAQVRPFAVDVSSGVEAEPGRKDHALLRAFIRAVRRADRAL